MISLGSGRWLLCGVAACAAWMLSGQASPTHWYSRYDDARIIQILILAVGAIWIALRPERLSSSLFVLPPPIRNSILLFFILGVLSATQAQFSSYAFLEVAFFGVLLALGLALRPVSGGHPGTVHIAMCITIAGAMALAVRLATDFIAAVVLQDASGLASSWAVFGNPRYFAKAATWAVPLLWVAPFISRKPVIQIAAATGSMVIWAHLIGSGSRGAIGALVGSAAIAGFAFGLAGKAYARSQICYIISGTILWGGFAWWFGSNAPNRLIAARLSYRDVLFKAALADVQESPLLGIGPMHFAALDRHPEAPGAGPHSFIFQLLAEWGIPATGLAVTAVVLAMILFLRAIRTTLRTDMSSEKATQIAFFAGGFAALAHASVSNVMNDPVSQTLAVLTIALASPAFNVTPQAFPPRLWGNFPLRLLILLAIGCLYRAGEYGKHCASDPNGTQLVRGVWETIYPRLWTQGLIPYEMTCKSAAEN